MFVVPNNFQLGNTEDSHLGISIDTCFRRSCGTSSPDEFPFFKYIQHRNASRQLKADNLIKKCLVNNPITSKEHQLLKVKHCKKTNTLYKYLLRSQLVQMHYNRTKRIPMGSNHHMLSRHKLRYNLHTPNVHGLPYNR